MNAALLIILLLVYLLVRAHEYWLIINAFAQMELLIMALLNVPLVILYGYTKFFNIVLLVHKKKLIMKAVIKKMIQMLVQNVILH